MATIDMEEEAQPQFGADHTEEMDYWFGLAGVCQLEDPGGSKRLW